jgi:hypothetical protein
MSLQLVNRGHCASAMVPVRLKLVRAPRAQSIGLLSSQWNLEVIGSAWAFEHARYSSFTAVRAAHSFDLRYYAICVRFANVRITWDPAKNEADQARHHLSFEEAAKVFALPEQFRFTAYDREHSVDEDRWISVGLIS